MACLIDWRRNVDRSSALPSAVTTEFELIERLKARVARSRSDPAVLIGIGDDAAVIRPESGMALVATTDSLVLGRHFEADWPAEDVGYLALAVNLSDLAAMGAIPHWALLSLTLPEADPVWLDRFLDGFLGLADDSGTTLVGGNIAAGPLNIGVTLMGQEDADALMPRSGSRAGNAIMVTGTLGDAAAALQLGARAPADLIRRLRRPSPRLEAGAALASLATSMIDVSDGLLADLAHLVGEQLGAEIDLAALPTSSSLRGAFPDSHERWRLQLSGGNDYELLFSLRSDRVDACRRVLSAMDVPVSVIGKIRGRHGVVCNTPDGGVLSADRYGWDHFAR
jgi:thiamine-monophosphate kinase